MNRLNTASHSTPRPRDLPLTLAAVLSVVKNPARESRFYAGLCSGVNSPQWWVVGIYGPTTQWYL
jgi:hypothetical protein